MQIFAASRHDSRRSEASTRPAAQITIPSAIAVAAVGNNASVAPLTAITPNATRTLKSSAPEPRAESARSRAYSLSSIDPCARSRSRSRVTFIVSPHRMSPRSPRTIACSASGVAAAGASGGATMKAIGENSAAAIAAARDPGTRARTGFPTGRSAPSAPPARARRDLLDAGPKGGSSRRVVSLPSGKMQTSSPASSAFAIRSYARS